MKKKLLLTLFFLLSGIAINAADFKVGDAKYEVLPDGTAQLKEYKKATGDVMIPEKVTDPKGGNTYTVTSIGKGAFKKAPLTSATIPASVIDIGNEAFIECANLNSVKFLGDISAIPNKCFYNCSSLANIDINLRPLYEVADNAFVNCKFGDIAPINVILIGGTQLYTYGIISHNEKNHGFPMVIVGEDVDVYKILAMRDEKILPMLEEATRNYYVGSENRIESMSKRPQDQHNNSLIEAVKSQFKNVSPTGEDMILIFTDSHPGFPALDIFKAISPEEYCIAFDNVNNYANYPQNRNSYLNRLNVKNLHEYLVRHFKHLTFSTYFGATIEDDGDVSVNGECLDAITAIEKSVDNIERNNFLNKVHSFIRTAVEDPAALQYEYRNIEPEEAFKYNTELTNAIRVLCDSVYLVKPELTKAEHNNLYGFIKNLYMGIGGDYGIANCHLDTWAEYDVLAKDIASGDHKEDYQRILMAIDRYHKDDKNAINDQDYLIAMQLGALCGLERWEEAANYFPKFIRAYTDDGKRNVSDVPDEIKYIKNAINSHGYKAVIPSFNKNRVASKSKSSSKDNGSLIEFFAEKALNAGIERYKKKKAQKEFRELYYQSIGLDKKGRPIKSKKR